MAEPLLQIRTNSLVQYSLVPRYFQNIPESGNLPPGFFSVYDRETGELIHEATVDMLHDKERYESIRNAYSGKFTNGAKKRLRKSIELLSQAAKEYGYIKNPVSKKYHPFQLVFITLTFPLQDEISRERQIPSAEAQKTCLEPFLRWMRESCGATMYVWKAELQSKNRKQLHYHITADCFIHHKNVRAKWNEIQTKAGYVDYYYSQWGDHNPPGTEIKGVRNKKDLAGYLEKKLMKVFTIIDETTKDIQNTDELNKAISIYGKVWDCSLNLKSEDYYTATCTGETCDNLIQMIENREVDVIELPRCTIFKLKPGSNGKIPNANKVLGKYDRREYTGFIERIRRFKRYEKRPSFRSVDIADMQASGFIFEEPDPPPKKTTTTQ